MASIGNKLQLYSFFMSSCSFRVRIALNIKGLKYEYKAINLMKNEQQSPVYPSVTVMKIQCDVCHQSEVAVYCTADEASLCSACDHRVHLANKLASKHTGFSLLHPSFKDSPRCDICQEGVFVLQRRSSDFVQGTNDAFSLSLCHITKRNRLNLAFSTPVSIIAEFLKINPIGLVPALVDDDVVLADSLAIILYLEEKYPEHPLLPRDLAKKAINYQAANIVSSSIQPLLSFPVMNFIGENVGPEAKLSWIQSRAAKGFTALEKLLKDHAGKYATGDEIFLADLFLAPQVIGLSQRFNFDMSEFPLLSRLSEAYMHVPAIQDAMAENQPDCPIN